MNNELKEVICTNELLKYNDKVDLDVLMKEFSEKGINSIF